MPYIVWENVVFLVSRKENMTLKNIKKEQNNYKKFCRKCGVNPQRPTHTWCLECYKKYKNKWEFNNLEHVKDYRNKDKGYYLYIVLNKDNKVLYVGSTEHLYNRIHSHINCGSNISKLMETDKWDKVKYLDVSKLVENRQELNLLENSLIELYAPEWNTKKNIIKNMDKLREFSLLAELHSFDINKKFKTYITKKKELSKSDQL